MSKDLKPYELHLFDRQRFLETGTYLHNDRIYIVMGNVRQEIGYLANEEVAKRYPNLGFLFDEFTKLYELKYQHNDEALKVCDEVEKILKGVIEKYDNGNYLCFDPINEYKFVEKWYLGELDKNFYYAEENNRKFQTNIDSLIYLRDNDFQYAFCDLSDFTDIDYERD